MVGLLKKQPTQDNASAAVVARHIRSVPAERIFSLAGNIVTHKRTKLTSSNVDIFIFLAKNIP
jgi:hypothetical protein